MPKEIRSSATRDASSVSNDAALREEYNGTEPPDARYDTGSVEEDLRHHAGSLEKQARNRQPGRTGLSSSRELEKGRRNR